MFFCPLPSADEGDGRKQVLMTPFPTSGRSYKRRDTATDGGGGTACKCLTRGYDVDAWVRVCSLVCVSVWLYVRVWEM